MAYILGEVLVTYDIHQLYMRQVCALLDIALQALTGKPIFGVCEARDRIVKKFGTQDTQVYLTGIVQYTVFDEIRIETWEAWIWMDANGLFIPRYVHMCDRMFRYVGPHVCRNMNCAIIDPAIAYFDLLYPPAEVRVMKMRA